MPELCTETGQSRLELTADDTSFVFRQGPVHDLKLEGGNSFPPRLMRLTGDLAGFITTIEDFAVLIVNEVLVAHLVFSILWMQKAFELQSFENMLQSLQIFGWFFNPSHQFDDKKAPFVGVGTLHKNRPLIEGIRQQHRCCGGRDVRVFVWLVRFVVAWLVLGYFFFFFLHLNFIWLPPIYFQTPLVSYWVFPNIFCSIIMLITHVSYLII